MQKLQIIILVLLLLIPQTGKGFDLPFFSPSEKEAQSFVDKVVPEIVVSWDETVLARYAHPEFYKTAPRNKVDELFFSCRMLGPLQKYKTAKGEIMEIKTSAGRKYVTGRYVAEADFEKGPASIEVSIAKEDQKWMITGFYVSSEAFAARDNSEKALTNTNKELSREEMKKMAEAFLQEDDIVGRRHGVDEIYPIAALFVVEGEMNMALQLYDKALESDPANLDRQLEYGELLLAEGRNKDAAVVFHLIDEMAENADLLAQSEKRLSDLGGSSPSQSCSIADDAEIVIMPVGNPNTRILQELCQKLQEKMGMTVRIDSHVISPGSEPDRKLKDRYTADVFQDVNDKISILQKDAILTSLKFDAMDLQTPENQSRFLLKFFSLLGDAGEPARQGYEANLAQLGEEGQYDIERLSDDMRRAIPFDRNEKTKVYVGVTEKDLFRGKGNFLFGGTTGAYGIISYYRYTAAINGEKQSRQRLISRLLKQALSSVNFALGIPRCNTPYCARSFPQNISEHDAKGEDLCPECRQSLESYKKDPRSNTSAYEYFVLGEKYRVEKKWDQAVLFFKKAIEHHSEQAPSAYQGLGKTYFDQRRYVEADESFQDFFNLSASNGVAEQDLPMAVQIGNSFLAREQLEIARYYFSRILDTDEQNINAIVFMGDFHKKKGNDGKAEEFYRRAIEIDPDGFLSNLGMAGYLGEKGKSAEAVKHYEKSLGHMPKDAEVHRVVQVRYNLGMEYFRQGSIDKAEEHLKEALIVDPAFFQALNSLGQIYGKSGRLDEALAKFKEAVEIKPTDADAWNDLGYTYYLKKEHRDAVNQYEKALNIAPGNGLCHYNKALVHFALQEFDRAIHHADMAKNCGYPGNPQFHKALAPHRK
ncbi:MAG: tetratricopeptide repeat protein [Pseudomonadota bacterium]